MKIFCIGRNYSAHIEELKNERPDRPLIFMKPATALLREEKPFYIPEFSQNVHYECELVIRIGKHGKAIEPQFVDRYIDGYSLGIDFTARDVQDQLKSKGHPWEIAKAFDYSACIGTILPVTEPKDWSQVQFQLLKNGDTVQEGDSAQMIFSVKEMIVYLSQFFTLQKGDLIFTGSPAGVAQVHPGDVLEGILEGQKVLHCPIK